MKRIRPFFSGLVVCAFALATATNLTAQTLQEGIGKVVGIKGSARYMTTTNAAWQPLKVGMILKSGATVQTAAKSSVDIVFNNSDAFESPSPTIGDVMAYQPRADQDAIRVMEDTVLVIDKLAVSETGADRLTDTELDLKAGRIFGTVRKLSATSKYEIKLPNGVAGIRGTIYYASADGVITVIVGSVLVSYIASDGTVKTQLVNAGWQFDARTGLLTPIPPELEMFLRNIAWVLHIQPTPPTTITVDHTIYNVSPISNRGGGGGTAALPTACNSPVSVPGNGNSGRGGNGTGNNFP
jgi:hypothetical protein